MLTALHVNKETVRRFLLERQGLHRENKAKVVHTDGVLTMVKALECVQLDPVAAVERNQHLVLQARLPGYQSATLEQLLEQRRVFEYWANAQCVIPKDDYPLFEIVRRRLTLQLQPELDRLGSVVQEVTQRLEREGPLPSRAFASMERVHGYWDSSAQPKTKATSHALGLLHDMGRIHVVRREGTTRYFDIFQRAVPQHLIDDALRISEAEAKQDLVEKYMRAFRVFDPGDARFGWQRMTAAERRQAVQQRVNEGRVVPLAIEGVKRHYFLLTEDADRLMALAAKYTGGGNPSSDTVQFLPPLDNLLWRRERVEDLFGFSYTWEVYMPAAKRRYGYYAMPILVDDVIIGRIDPKLVRDQGRLDIRLLQIEPGVRFTKALRRKVMLALKAFAEFHGVKVGEIERIMPEGIR